MAAALALGLGSQPMSSRADVLTSNSNTSNTTTELLEYTLTANQNIAGVTGTPPAQGSSNPPTPELVATIAPVSVVTPPAGSNSQPLQIMPVPDANGYYYMNPNQLSVYVGNNPLDGTAITQQALGLSFYGPGLAKGQSVTFTLPFDTSIVGGNPPMNVPQFTAIDPTSLQAYAGSAIPYTIKYDGVVQSTTTGGTGSGSNPPPVSPQDGSSGGETPEPFSLLVWTALAGAGIWRARARRVGPRD
jgi:hypothetical protein